MRVCQKFRFLKSANFEERAFLSEFFNKIIDYDRNSQNLVFSEVLDQKTHFWSFSEKSTFGAVSYQLIAERVVSARLPKVPISSFEKCKF